ncbi:MAG: hypothetical protein ACLR6J_14430 [Parabacteroides merdae]
MPHTVIEQNSELYRSTGQTPGSHPRSGNGNRQMGTGKLGTRSGSRPDVREYDRLSSRIYILNEDGKRETFQSEPERRISPERSRHLTIRQTCFRLIPADSLIPDRKADYFPQCAQKSCGTPTIPGSKSSTSPTSPGPSQSAPNCKPIEATPCHALRPVCAQDGIERCTGRIWKRSSKAWKGDTEQSGAQRRVPSRRIPSSSAALATAVGAPYLSICRTGITRPAQDAERRSATALVDTWRSRRRHDPDGDGSKRRERFPVRLAGARESACR